MKYLIVLLLFPSFSFGQRAKFKEIRLRPDKHISTNIQDTIVYPIISSGNIATDHRINNHIKSEIFGTDSPHSDLSVNVLLDSAIKDNLMSMSYTVTFNNSGVLSINISTYGCGAYCSGETYYFNFDIHTGKLLTIKDILKPEKIDSFKGAVFKRKIKYLKEYKDSLKTDADNVSKDDSVFANENVNLCMKSVDITKFSISKTGIEIFDNCEFPTAILPLSPDYHLIYQYQQIRDILKPWIAKKIYW